MALIANLAVALTAQTGQFAAKLMGARKTVSSFASSVTGALTGTTAKVTGLLGAITGVGSIGALVHFTKQAMEGIDTTAKLADRLGSTTEQLIGLQHAANLGGADIETLAGALDKLTKNLGAGSAEVDSALASIGLSRASLLGKGAAEQFTEISEALKHVQSAELRASVTTQLLGKSGQQLSAVLALGRDGLAQAAEEATKLGISFSRVDAFKVEAANDAASKLGATLHGAFIQLGITAAPILEALSNKLTDLVTQGGGLGQVVKDSFTGLVGILDSVVTALGDVAAAFARVGASVLELSPKIRELFPFITSVVDHFTRREGATDQEINDVALGAAGRLRNTSDSILAATGPGSVSSLVNPILAAAQKKAEADAAAQAAKDAKAGQFRSAAQPFVDALAAGLKQAPGLVGDLFSGAGRQLQEDNAAKLDFRNRLSRALDPATEFFSGEGAFAPSKIAKLASAGTRGTFASDTAGRSVGTFSIEREQLEVQKEIAQQLEELNDNIVGGVPVG
jgi:hypothetical protein